MTQKCVQCKRQVHMCYIFWSIERQFWKFKTFSGMSVETGYWLNFEFATPGIHHAFTMVYMIELDGLALPYTFCWEGVHHAPLWLSCSHAKNLSINMWQTINSLDLIQFPVNFNCKSRLLQNLKVLKHHHILLHVHINFCTLYTSIRVELKIRKISWAKIFKNMYIIEGKHQKWKIYAWRLLLEKMHKKAP